MPSFHSKTPQLSINVFKFWQDFNPEGSCHNFPCLPRIVPKASFSLCFFMTLAPSQCWPTHDPTSQTTAEVCTPSADDVPQFHRSWSFWQKKRWSTRYHFIGYTGTSFCLPDSVMHEHLVSHSSYVPKIVFRVFPTFFMSRITFGGCLI